MQKKEKKEKPTDIKYIYEYIQYKHKLLAMFFSLFFCLFFILNRKKKKKTILFRPPKTVFLRQIGESHCSRAILWTECFECGDRAQ